MGKNELNKFVEREKKLLADLEAVRKQKAKAAKEAREEKGKIISTAILKLLESGQLTTNGLEELIGGEVKRKSDRAKLNFSQRKSHPSATSEGDYKQPQSPQIA